MHIRCLPLLIMVFCAMTLYPQVEIEVELHTETGILKGTLATPDGEEDFPVVLMIAGSGPTDRDGNNPVMTNNSLKFLAEALLEERIGSLRYDKRGIAASASAATSEENLRFETYVEDAVRWVRKLREDHGFDQVSILGHSEGSLIGMIAAERTKAARFISLAGAGKAAAEILREQLRSQPPLVTAMTDPILDSLEMGKTVDSINPMLHALFRPSVQPYLISWFAYDPAEEISKLDCPVLLLQGTTDIQVKVEDAELLAAASPQAVKVILEGMNHILKNAPENRLENINTYNDPTLPLSEGLIPSLVSFIRR